jgi:hypothetical protein
VSQYLIETALQWQSNILGLCDPAHLEGRVMHGKVVAWGWIGITGEGEEHEFPRREFRDFYKILRR